MAELLVSACKTGSWIGAWMGTIFKGVVRRTAPCPPDRDGVGHFHTVRVRGALCTYSKLPCSVRIFFLIIKSGRKVWEEITGLELLTLASTHLVKSVNCDMSSTQLLTGCNDKKSAHIRPDAPVHSGGGYLVYAPVSVPT